MGNSIHPKTKEVLLKAGRKMGKKLRPSAERAGTTCAMLASRGINGGPCIFGGQHAMHSVYEWVSIEELVETMGFCAYVVEEVAGLKGE